MHSAEYDEAALRVLRSGHLILGPEVEAFEKEFSAFHGEDIYCAGLASGLDALWIGMKLLGIGPGDEVIIQGNAYIASVMGITINGATPVFTEPGPDSQTDPDNVEKAITPRTKAVVAVHLYGQMCDMDRLSRICSDRGLL
ncbi:MAG: DegT/DnrJ/EryC1/StrS family aminotransferase, partial [Lachnospiraceae bacterium]|nr:DegT/DnrJ/EryC1/StrS family aminotransferase [Lachnospiraceae bacterium]